MYKVVAPTYPTHTQSSGPTHAIGPSHSLVNSPTPRKSTRFSKAQDNDVVDVSLSGGVITPLTKSSHWFVSKVNLSSQQSQ